MHLPRQYYGKLRTGYQSRAGYTALWRRKLTAGCQSPQWSVSLEWWLYGFYAGSYWGRDLPRQHPLRKLPDQWYHWSSLRRMSRLYSQCLYTRQWRAEWDILYCQHRKPAMAAPHLQPLGQRSLSQSRLPEWLGWRGPFIWHVPLPPVFAHPTERVPRLGGNQTQRHFFTKR